MEAQSHGLIKIFLIYIVETQNALQSLSITAVRAPRERWLTMPVQRGHQKYIVFFAKHPQDLTSFEEHESKIGTSHPPASLSLNTPTEPATIISTANCIVLTQPISNKLSARVAYITSNVLIGILR
jgi:hypothetical protein